MAAKVFKESFVDLVCIHFFQVIYGIYSSQAFVLIKVPDAIASDKFLFLYYWISQLYLLSLITVFSPLCFHLLVSVILSFFFFFHHAVKSFRVYLYAKFPTFVPIFLNSERVQSSAFIFKMSCLYAFFLWFELVSQFQVLLYKPITNMCTVLEHSSYTKFLYSTTYPASPHGCQSSRLSLGCIVGLNFYQF